MLEGGSMMNEEIALKLSDSIFKWFESFLNRKALEKEKEREALRSIMSSLFETTSYMRECLNKDDYESYEKERELGRMWYETSILVQPFHPDLSQRCFFKGLYWANKNSYSEDELIAKKMKLSDIQSDISEALKRI